MFFYVINDVKRAKRHRRSKQRRTQNILKELKQFCNRVCRNGKFNPPRKANGFCDRVKTENQKPKLDIRFVFQKQMFQKIDFFHQNPFFNDKCHFIDKTTTTKVSQRTF